MKTYLFYVRQYDICVNDYRLRVVKVITDNVYRIVGKMYYTALEKIDRIDVVEYLEERERFWRDHGYTIQVYREPHLSFDN